MPALPETLVEKKLRPIFALKVGKSVILCQLLLKLG
jgi:hypothetical protein